MIKKVLLLNNDSGLNLSAGEGSVESAALTAAEGKHFIRLLKGGLTGWAEILNHKVESLKMQQYQACKNHINTMIQVEGRAKTPNQTGQR